MPKICKQTYNILYRLTHKIYRVEYLTHGKILRRRFISMWRWESFNMPELVKAMARDLKLKPDHIRVKNVTRAYWQAMA